MLVMCEHEGELELLSLIKLLNDFSFSHSYLINMYVDRDLVHPLLPQRTGPI